MSHYPGTSMNVENFIAENLSLNLQKFASVNNNGDYQRTML